MFKAWPPRVGFAITTSIFWGIVEGAGGPPGLMGRKRAVILEGPKTSVGEGWIDSDDPLRGRVSGRLSQYVNRSVGCAPGFTGLLGD